MATTARDIKFQETLRDLLEQSKATVTHKKLGSAIGVSPTTVSHYVTGRIKPSFEALLGIAVFFNVTLDYLVFGERTTRSATEMPETLRTSVRRAVAQGIEYSGRQRDLMIRVNRVLVHELESITQGMLDNPENFGPAGFFTDDEAMAVESCALDTKVMIRTAPADISVDDVGEASPGDFFQTMVENLNARRRYEFIFYGKRPAFAPFAGAYRSLLAGADVEPGIVYENLAFRVIDSELPTGVVIHELDLALLQRREPILWEKLNSVEAIVGDTLAYTAVRHKDAKGGVVLYGTYLESAVRMFRRDWAAAGVL